MFAPVLPSASQHRRIRHPYFKWLREDKQAKDVKRERPA